MKTTPEGEEDIPEGSSPPFVSPGRFFPTSYNQEKAKYMKTLKKIQVRDRNWS